MQHIACSIMDVILLYFCIYRQTASCNTLPDHLKDNTLSLSLSLKIINLVLYFDKI